MPSVSNVVVSRAAGSVPPSSGAFDTYLPSVTIFAQGRLSDGLRGDVRDSSLSSAVDVMWSSHGESSVFLSKSLVISSVWVKAKGTIYIYTTVISLVSPY